MTLDIVSKTHRIAVEDSGQQFDCPEDKTVLSAMKADGHGPLHYGCFGGGCGVCKMRVVSGSYHVIQRMSRAHVSEAEQAEGILLICCIEPRGDLILRHI